MAMPRWRPKQTYSPQEKALMKRLRRTRKLFAFLRAHRREIFDEEFQQELESMYRDTGAGKEPLPPAILAMAALLQGYVGVSDAEAVEMTVVDLRWQMVLDRLGEDQPAFSQGAFFNFRERLIRHEMDRRVLERTAEFARKTKEFDWKKLPKSLRVAFDSSPLEGAGRVEDTINLLAHAGRKLVACAATILGWSEEKVARQACAPLLLESSIKKALDVEWSRRGAKQEALNRLVRQLDSLEAWVRQRLSKQSAESPLKEELETLRQIRDQDLEPDPSGAGGVRIREGVAKDRRVSIEDPDMRHGRKSNSKSFNGYKRHIATDLDTTLIVACAVTPANQPEQEAADLLKEDIEHQQRNIKNLHIDRGYVSSPVVEQVLEYGGDVFCKPWRAQGKGGRFTKDDFKINIRAMTIMCPAGEAMPIELDSSVEFAPESCGDCDLRDQCTAAKPGRGRSVHIANDERIQQRFRKRIATRRGRSELRQRVHVEHRLAHMSSRQGRRARYRGIRKNLYDVRRAASIQNLEACQRRAAEVELRNAA